MLNGHPHKTSNLVHKSQHFRGAEVHRENGNRYKAGAIGITGNSAFIRERMNAIDTGINNGSLDNKEHTAYNGRETDP